MRISGGRGHSSHGARHPVQSVDRVDGRTLVEKVDQRERRDPTVLRVTRRQGLSETAGGVGARCVGHVDLVHVRGLDVKGPRGVQKVVDKGHTVARDGGLYVVLHRGGPVRRAREIARVRVVERVLEDEGELVHHVTRRGVQFRVGEVPTRHESHEPLPARDDVLQRRPRLWRGGDGRRHVRLVDEVGVQELGVELGGSGVVRVDQQHRHDFVRVVVEPGLDRLEPVRQESRVEQVTGRVAQVPLRVCHVYLGGHQTDPGGQLHGRVVVLISRDREACRGIPNEGGVVGTEVDDRVVWFRAEIWGVVAGFCA